MITSAEQKALTQKRKAAKFRKELLHTFLGVPLRLRVSLISHAT
jgi:hypothetical protein